MKEFEGTVIVSAQQLYQLVEAAVETVLNKQQSTPSITNQKEMTAKEAARELKYESPRTLRQYHHVHLQPIRRGRRLFYRSDEVMKLKSKLFNKL